MTTTAAQILPDFSKFKIMPADEIQKRKDNEHSAKVATFRANWNAPKRHEQSTPNFSGEWGAAYSQLKAKLGTGSTIALVGTRGSGKTQLAVELMKATTANLKRAYFTTATGFFMELKATYRKEASKTEGDVLNTFQSFQLLVIDEIGKRSESEWENNLLFELLNRRYNAMKDTVLIDNRSKADFIAAIGESLASRMNEGGGIKECNWPSFRS